MNTLSQQLKKDLDFLLSEHSYDVAFTRKGVGASYDIVSGRETGGTTDTETVSGVFVSNTSGRFAGITRDSRVFIMRPDGVSKAPRTNDELTEGGQTVKIETIRTIKSKDVVLAYICGVSG